MAYARKTVTYSGSCEKAWPHMTIEKGPLDNNNDDDD